MQKYEFQFSGGIITMLNKGLFVKVECLNPMQFSLLSAPNNPHNRWVQIPEYRIILRHDRNYSENDVKPFVEFYLSNVIAKSPTTYKRYKIRTY